MSDAELRAKIREEMRIATSHIVDYGRQLDAVADIAMRYICEERERACPLCAIRYWQFREVGSER